MTITQNGNSFTWDGTVTVTNATDITTGVATLVLTPRGGVGQLPVLAQGPPGASVVFDSLNVSTLAPGSSATGSITTVSSGTPGVPPHYALNFGIPTGATGYSLNATQTVTIIGGPVAGTFVLSYGGQTTVPIAWNAPASAVQSALQTLSTVGSGNVTVQGASGGPWVCAFASTLGAISTLGGVSSMTGGTGGSSQVVSISATGGTYTLTYGGATTSALAFNASAVAVQAALAGLSTIGSGNVTVSGLSGGPYTVNFGPLLTPVSVMTATGSLTGGSAAVAVTGSATVSVQGNYTLAGASDLDSTSTTLQDQYMIKWQGSEGKFKYAAQPVGGTLQLLGIGSYNGNNPRQSLGFLTIPAQLFNWIPDVKGMCIPTGTANTHVDMVAILTGSWPSGPGTSLSTGWQVGYGNGITGAGSGAIPAYPVNMYQAFGGNLTSGYGVVPAGYSCILYFATNQTAATTDSYTAPATGAYFSCHIDPVPGTN